MENITSRNNRTVIEASKLKDKKYRDSTNLYCFEGRKLFLEAYTSGVEFVSIFVTEKSHNDLTNILDMIDCPIYTVTDTVYSKLSDDKAPDGIFAVCRKASRSVGYIGKCFILSELRDPGNLGTCIRSARAFGIDTLILHNCADAYNPKVIRSSMGAFFRQNFICTDNVLSTVTALKDMGYTVYPTALADNSISLDKIQIDHKTVFIVGNEGHGVSKEIIDSCDRTVIIPMAGDTESLNASIAASILMWEISN